MRKRQRGSSLATDLALVAMLMIAVLALLNLDDFIAWMNGG